MRTITQDDILLFTLATGRKEKAYRIAGMGEEELDCAAVLLQYANKEELLERGYAEGELPNTAMVSLLNKSSSVLVSSINSLLQEFFGKERTVTFQIVGKHEPEGKYAEQYLSIRTTLLFNLFNDGVLRGTSGVAREALISSFSLLPTRYLSSDGRFMINTGSKEIFFRGLDEESYIRDGYEYAGLDKFPSLMAVRAMQLRIDGNRIVPSAIIRDGVYVGKRNIFMFHSAVNLCAFIGDDNLIDSHVSVGSAAQIGNRNKIGSFVSLEGVLSPANESPVIIGDNNFLGSFVRMGTGITVGNENFFASGVNLSQGTKLKDCREKSSTRGDYVTVLNAGKSFDKFAILTNTATRKVNGVEVLPGEYILVENTPDFMKRFEGDIRIRTKR